MLIIFDSMFHELHFTFISAKFDVISFLLPIGRTSFLGSLVTLVASS